MQQILSFFLSPKFIAVLIAIVLLYAIFPILIAFAGFGLAELFGCQSGGSGPQFTCPNPEMGKLFTYMGFMHWFGLVTLPTGLPVAGVLVIILALRLVMLQQRSGM